MCVVLWLLASKMPALKCLLLVSDCKMCVLLALQEFEEDCGDEPRLGGMPGQSMGRCVRAYVSLYSVASVLP